MNRDESVFLPSALNLKERVLKKTILVALALTVLAGCASTEDVQLASNEQTYTPLGTLLPRKVSQNKDDRTFIDKEDFKRQQEAVGSIQSKAN